MDTNHMKAKGYKGNVAFKRSMIELLKNHRVSNHIAEERIGLEKDFIEKVSRGISKLTLDDAIKIADFFDTTIDSVIHGNGNEIRVKNSHSSDLLVSKYFEDCVHQYVDLLNTKAMDYRRTGLFDSEILDSKVKLERNEHIFFECYKTYMDEYERRRTQLFDAKEICDDVLITELQQRGFTIERK